MTEGATVAKANQNLTVYLDEDLANEVAEAKAAGKLDPKTVVKTALRAHLDGDIQEGSTEVAQLRMRLESERARVAFVQHEIGVALGLDSSDSTAPSLETILGVIHDLRTHPLRQAAAVDPESSDANPAQGTVYELRYAESWQEALNLVDVINEHHGRMESAATDRDGKFVLLIAWPQEQ
jgi:hypothetical protein